MSKYDSLANHLANASGTTVTMSFDAVNALVAGGLPASAFAHRPWWANRFDGKDAQNIGWQSVGWQTADVDMQKRQVTFLRTASLSPPRETRDTQTLTIEEAKRGLAATFKVPMESIEIIIRA